MLFHADKAIQSTQGTRGKTTERATTHTVQGPEGSYIAQMKEELAARPPVTGWELVCVRLDGTEMEWGCSTNKEKSVAFMNYQAGCDQANGWSEDYMKRRFYLRRCLMSYQLHGAEMLLAKVAGSETAEVLDAVIQPPKDLR